MSCHRLFFKLFLVIYGGFLFAHVWGMGFHSWLLFAGMFGGIAVALAAHKGAWIPTYSISGRSHAHRVVPSRTSQ